MNLLCRTGDRFACPSVLHCPECDGVDLQVLDGEVYPCDDRGRPGIRTEYRVHCRTPGCGATGRAVKRHHQVTEAAA